MTPNRARATGPASQVDRRSDVRPRGRRPSAGRGATSRHGVALAAVALAACGGCATQTNSTQKGFGKAVEVSAEATLIHDADSVTFTARIRPDIARRISPSGTRDSADAISHIVGWFWVPDLYAPDPWTHACTPQLLVCRTAIYGAGTMVFSVRVGDEICADWVHIETLSYPDVTGDDPKARKHQDSVNAAMRTKAPTWQRCTA